MWFPAILVHMSQRYLPERDQMQAYCFIVELYRCFSSSFYPTEPVPVELRLGVLDNMYSWLKMTNKEDIDLQSFAQTLFGLLIFYTKYVSDDEIWCSDFIDLTKNATVYKTLAIQREHLRRYFHILEKIDRLGIKTDILTDTQIAELIKRSLVLIFRRMERDVMNFCRHSASLDYDNLIHLIKRPWNRSVRQAFSDECMNLVFTCPGMGNLVDSVSPIVRVGYNSMTVPLRIWRQVTERSLSQNEERYLTKIFSLQEQLHNLRMKLKNSVGLFADFCSLRGLEKELLPACIAYFSGQTEHRVFLRSTVQAVRKAASGLHNQSWLSDWNDLILDCAKLNPLCSHTVKSQYACSDLFFSPTKTSKPVRAADHSESHAFLEQSF